MSVLVYIDNDENKISKNSYEAASYASQLATKLNTEVIGIVLGNCSNVQDIGKYGVSKVLHCSNETFNAFNPETYTAAIAQAGEENGADTYVFSHDFSGKSIAPRLAAKLDAGMVTGAVKLPDLEHGFIVKKAVFSGKAFADVKINTPRRIISVLPNSIDKVENNVSVEVKEFNPQVPASKLKVVSKNKATGELSLSEADIVVSGGRGLKGPENWGMIEELAKELGAATACSRPVADIGWRPHHEHVGQTGLAIRPNLYIAIGISGAIQHLAGVNGSKVIVVINTDPEAPFFKAADYGIVGDAFEVVPKLIEAVKKLKSN